jgi:DNA polymerase-3 subunit gamma/tau
MLDAVSDSDTPKALSITADLYDMSKDLTRLCEELITQLRNVMLIKASPDTADKLIVCMPDELERLKAIAEKSDLPTVMDRLSALQECRERMQRAMNKRVEFEMSLIKLCGNVKNTAESIDNSEIYDKIKQLEDKINTVPRAVPTAGQPAEEKPEVLEASAVPADEKIIPTIDIKKLKAEDIIPCERWNDILDEFRNINPAVAGSLDGSFAGTAGNYIFITAQNRFFMELFKVKENANSLGTAIAKVLGQRFIIKARCATTVTEQKNLAESLIKKAMDSKIETAVENQ